MVILTAVDPRTPEPDRGSAGFAADGPYDRALRVGGGRLDVAGGPQARVFDVARFCGPADPVDRGVLLRLRGPLLDVGCGPGRIVAAALDLGMLAVGVDVSAAAIELASRTGLPVLRRSVFARMPMEGAWASVVLLDGNIGIGGDPAALLRRSAALLRADGEVLIEVDHDPDYEAAFTGALTTGAGHRGDPFAWAEVGANALARIAARAGLHETDRFSDGGRSFVLLALGR